VIGAPPSPLYRAFTAPATSSRLLVLSEFGSEAGQLLERLVLAGYTPMLTSSMCEAVRLAAEHRPLAVLSHLRHPTDHAELARLLDADERTRDIPSLQVRRGWRPTRMLERLARWEATAGVSPRLVIVANRGPNDFVWADGQWRTRPSSGGLVSMLAPLASRPDVAWCCCVSEPPDAAQARHGLYTTAADQAESGLHVVPIPMPAPMFHAYYGQISNEVLWMVQHGLPVPPDVFSPNSGRARAWEHGYLAANARLARSIAATDWKPEAFLLQDYHLYPLPAMLRARFPSTPILHFIHIPFPGPAAWRQLPAAWCASIVRGLLGADVVGFQTGRDLQHFLDCCRSFLGCRIDGSAQAVWLGDGRRVRVRVYPASVSPEEVRSALTRPELTITRRSPATRHDQQTIVRVDRLDPSKNQLAGFFAFERLLDQHRELHGRVRFNAFLVPSRTDLEVYRTYRETVFGRIAAINARFAARCGGPVIQVYYTNDRQQALEAMANADVLLVNSLADGMNLVVKEWAVVSERPGVLVASDRMGAAAEADGCALLVDPTDVAGTASALGRALAMPRREREMRLRLLRERVEAWTARDWLVAQLRDLDIAPVEPLGSAPDAITRSIDVSSSPARSRQPLSPRRPAPRT
jgi:trehalose 6-phosphate synthase